MATFKVKAVLAGDGSQWQNTLRQGESAARRFGSSVKSMIGGQLAMLFSIGAIAQLTRKTIAFGASLRDMSSGLGIGVEWLQSTGYAAEQAGGSVEVLSKFLRKLAVAREEALQGGETGKRKQGAFGMFGITEADLRTMNMEQLHDKIASYYKKPSDVQGRIAALMEVGGKGAVIMSQAFVQGLSESRKEAYDMGLVMSSETVNGLAGIGDQFTTLGRILLVEFAPALLKTAELILTAVAVIKGSRGILGRTREGGNELPTGVKMLAMVNPVVLAAVLGQLTGKASVGAGSDMDLALEELAKKLVKLYTPTRPGAKEDDDYTPFYQMGGRGGGRGGKNKTYSDSLLAVGNFLGAGRGGVDRIQQQQLDVQRETGRDIKTGITIMRQLIGAATGFSV